jgi:hypothetical protein
MNKIDFGPIPPISDALQKALSDTRPKGQGGSMPKMSDVEIKQLKKDLRDCDEGECMQIDANAVADLRNEVEKLRNNQDKLKDKLNTQLANVTAERDRLREQNTAILQDAVAIICHYCADGSAPTNNKEEKVMAKDRLGFNHVSDEERRIAELEQQLIHVRERDKLRQQLVDAKAQIKWQRITPENLPKLGDEVAAFSCGGLWLLGIFIPTCHPKEKLLILQQGYTHFRPINAPQEGADDVHDPAAD